MKKRADDEGRDLLLVDTGDRIEGNGLYDSSTPKGLFQYDIFREQHVDIITIGNHELYQTYAADRELNTTVPNFKQNYIASNLDVIDQSTGKRVPLAQRYRRFKTKNQGIDILAFGFLFDFKQNNNNSFVQDVKDTVKESWFQDAIKQDPDMFVVAGHVGVRMAEYQTIFKAIRKQNKNIPIVFFSGHRHVRDAAQYDERSFALASGRYFETIGWMSVDGVKASEGKASALSDLKFSRKYIDTNLYGMYYHTGTNSSTFATKRGVETTTHIARARTALDLDYQFGCSPQNFWVSRADYPNKNSIYSWFTDRVMPDVVVKKGREQQPRLAVMNTGGIRFDLFKGAVTRDTLYLVSPFTSGWKYVADVPYPVAKKVLGILNSADKIISSEVPEASTLRVHSSGDVTQVVEDADDRLELRSLQSRTALTGGYTTRDDLGTDGDDTVHEPLQFYAMPNCVQSKIAFPEDGEPETVDLVFIDFIEPWVLPVLELAGGKFNKEDIQRYMDGTLASKMAEWITTNWPGSC